MKGDRLSVTPQPSDTPKNFDDSSNPFEDISFDIQSYKMESLDIELIHLDSQMNGVDQGWQEEGRVHNYSDNSRFSVDMRKCVFLDESSRSH